MKKYIIAFSLMLAGLSTNAQILTNSNAAPAVSQSNAFLDASTSYSSAAGENNNKHKGLVYPDVNLTTFVFENVIADGATLPSYYDGMMVYNTGTGATLTSGLNPSTATSVVPGFYYFSNPDGAANGNVSGGVWKAVGGTGTAITGANGVTVTNGNAKLGGTLTEFTTITTNNNLLFDGRVNFPGDGYFGLNGNGMLELGSTQGPVGFEFNQQDGHINFLNLVGIGTAYPSAKLDIIGTGNLLKLGSEISVNGDASGRITFRSNATDQFTLQPDDPILFHNDVYFESPIVYPTNYLSTAGAGKVLTSDANGTAAWQTPAAVTGSNGVTVTNGNAKLGGTLTEATNIGLGANNLTFQATSGSVVIANLDVYGNANMVALNVDEDITTSGLNASAFLGTNGTFRYSNGSQGAGKVLISDATGIASWSSALPIHANNAAAIAAGKTAGSFYHNGDGIVRVVF